VICQIAVALCLAAVLIT